MQYCARSSFSRVSVSDVAGWNKTHSPGRREIANPRGTPGDAFLLFRPPLTEIRAHRLRNHNSLPARAPESCPAKAGTGFASGHATKPVAARGRFEDKLLLLYNAGLWRCRIEGGPPRGTRGGLLSQYLPTTYFAVNRRRLQEYSS